MKSDPGWNIFNFSAEIDSVFFVLFHVSALSKAGSNLLCCYDVIPLENCLCLSVISINRVIFSFHFS